MEGAPAPSPHIMLYPLTLDPSPAVDTPNDLYVVQPGCLLAFTVVVEPGSTLDIVTAHVARTQDNSVRVWVSAAPGDTSVGNSVAVAFWHPNRSATEIVRLQDENLDLTGIPTISVPPGTYYVNALNLTNVVNQLRYTLTIS